MALPSEKGAEGQYQAALAEGKFLIQLCGDCHRHVFYPRQFCPHCDSDALAWVAPSGGATVYSATTVRLKPNAAYNVSIIELDEGVRMMSRVEGVAPDQVRIGMRVSPVVAERGGKPVVVFTMVEEQQ
ncbi:MAG: Zn-ribbon domain-containing OB-fold protein [Noviherbaspirillum sp.]